MDKFYKLPNGLQFNTLPEVKAYIRGLELMRGKLNLTAADSAQVADWLSDAHAAKAKGALTESQHAGRDQPAEQKKSTKTKAKKAA